MRIDRGVVWVAVGALVACDTKGAPPDAGPDPYQLVVELPAVPHRDLDVLFVVDDSPGMLDRQASLGNDFSTFINVLSTLPGGLPNLHLGVASTDMGTSAGSLVGPSIGTGRGSCSMHGKNGFLQKGLSGVTVTGAFISDVSSGPGMPRQTNYGDPTTLPQVFGQMVRLGAAGCGFEQPLSAARAALRPGNVANQGFLRQDALLAVVLVTDEDDCSLKDIGLLGPESAELGPLQSFRCTRFGVRCEIGGRNSDEMNQVGVKEQCGANPTSSYLDNVAGFRDSFIQLKADPKQVIVAGLMGPSAPFEVALRTPPGGTGAAQVALSDSCVSQSGASEAANPAARLQSLIDMFPTRSTSASICSTNLSDQLQSIGQLIVRSMGTPCLSNEPADADPEMAGVQFDCTVDDIVGTNRVEIPIMPCDAMLSPTCWSIETDAQACPLSPSHYKLVVHRTSEPPDLSAVTQMKCRL